MLARLVAATVMTFGLSGACWSREIPDLTALEWREDIDALVTELERKHRDAWNFVPRAEVARLADEAARQADKSEDYEMVVALQRIAAAIGDGHTFVDVSDRYARYPFETRWIENEFYIVRTTPDHAELLGARLVAIDGTPLERAVETLLSLVPRNENRWYERDALAGLLTQAEPLAALGITHSPHRAEIIVERADGGRASVLLIPHSPSAQPDFVTIGAGGRPTPVAPQRGLRLNFFGDVAFLDFAGYDNLEERSAAVWSEIDQVRPRALIIDVRKNRGGSLPAGRQFMVYPAWERSQLNRAGCLFVLTGPATFSAAMTNVTDLRRETEATIVGLPTGARPNGYQENGWFNLPNSGLRVSAAQRRYRFGNADETAVMPDLWAGQTIEDWRRSRDTALNAALSDARKCERRDSPGR